MRCMALKFGIGELGDQGLLADGMHRYDIAPASALGNGLMPDDRLAGGTAAEPARYRGRRSLVLIAVKIVEATMFGMFAGHTSV